MPVKWFRTWPSLLESLWEEEIVSEPVRVGIGKSKGRLARFFTCPTRHARCRRGLSSDSRVVSTFDVSWQAPSLTEGLACPILVCL